MKQEEFFNQLANELRYLPPKEFNKVMTYYRDRINIAIDYGEKEEAVIAGLPNPKKIAKDTYESYGPNFLTIQKKRLHNRYVLRSIVDILLMFVIFTAFIGVILLFGINFSHMFTLVHNVFGQNSVIDGIKILLFVICYILLFLIGFIYIANFIYFIFTHLFENVWMAFSSKKIPCFVDFSLVQTIKKVSHKKIFLIVVLCTCIGMVFTGVWSYVAKGYVYQSFENQCVKETLYDYDNIEEITFSQNEGKIYLVGSEDISSIRILYQYTFNNDYNASITDKKLVIKNSSRVTYDLLDFLREPTPILTIYIPTNKDNLSVNLSLDNGYVELNKVNCNVNLNVSIQSGSVVVSDSTMKNVHIESYRAKVGVSKGTFNELFIKSTSAQIVLDKLTSNIIEIDNGTAKNQITNVNATSFTYKTSSGEASITNLTSIGCNLQTKASLVNLVNISCDTFSGTIQATSKVTVNNSIISKLATFSVSEQSYLVIDYIKTPICKFTGNNGVFFLNNINVNMTETKDNLEFSKKYNLKTLDCDVTIDNNGVSSKTEIGTSKINLLTCNINYSYFYITDTTIKHAFLQLKNIEYAKFINVYGEVVVELTNISGLSYKNDDESSTSLTLSKYDASSVGSINSETDYKNVEVIVKEQ